MINYNPKDWSTFIFHIDKSDTFRKLWPLMLGVAIFSGLVAYAELNYFQLSKTSNVTNIGMMQLIGFCFVTFAGFQN